MHTDSRLSETEFFSALLPQTRQSFEVLYDQYAPVLYGVIRRLVAQEPAAQQVLQQSLETIWHNLDRYNPAKGSLFTWMTGIARHAAMEHVQQQDLLSPQPGGQDMQAEAAGLDADLQQLVHLAYFKGYSLESIAAMLAMPQETVMSRMRQAVLHLRDQQ